ncbi:MAG: NifB/NifX family molybdenum-iron cluster-binding protein [Desulfuromonadales bacterium]|nr:NifB/NifX family molybdenum-iron cluster-binding protein [Desulfuromonadales bacterium]MBN2792436.1 NifB/NifX family molybdenum-iron cluster-binding protein [Desulfuromonadales bacterium]
MIIAITAKEPSLKSEVDPRFGRAAYFLIANSLSGEVYAHDNSEGIAASNGAGTSAAQLMAENRVDFLYTGSVGPKAGEVLEKAGVKVFENTTGIVEEVLANLPQEVIDEAEAAANAPMETVDQPKNDAIRIAVPADSGQGLQSPRSGHFGKCAYYVLIDIKDNKIQEVISLQNGGHAQGNCSTPVLLLNGNHVNKLIVAGIGGRPLQGFREIGIDVLSGGGQTVEETINLYLSGQVHPITNDQVCGGGPQ